MKIILMRHGQAENHASSDSARQLTDYGQQQAIQTADYIVAHYQPDHFIVSPFDRAQQTLAQLQSRAPHLPTTVQDNITPSSDARTAFADIAKIDAECILIVCHMPIVAKLASLLTDDSPEAFALAEARVFETEFMMMGMAKELERFVPNQP